MADTVLDPERNRLYQRAEDLHPSHWERLSAREPEEAARATGARWTDGAFRLPLLGRELVVRPDHRTVTAGSGEGVGYQRALVAVSYLAGALDVPVAGRWVAFRDLPGGGAFFRGPHGLPTHRLEAAYGSRPGRLLEAAAAVGGTADPGADAAAVVPALPKVPVRVLLWARTEEFGGSASLLTDPRAHLHLALDGLWALANVLVADLVRGAGA